MANTDTVNDWLQLIHARYPADTAASWDNSGLQVGDPAWPVARVLLTLDVTAAVLDEANRVENTLVVAHHPMLFRPITRLTSDTPAGQLALKAAVQKVAVIAAHTNLDVAGDGTSTSTPLATTIGLSDVAPLTTTMRPHRDVKLVTFVPEAQIDAVRDALANAGAGQIGAYSACSFTTAGVGTFRPSPTANPAIATATGEQAHVSEQRLEMVVPRAQVTRVIAALQAHHPYEEVAYDLFERMEQVSQFGLIGTLPTPASVGEIAERIARNLPAPNVRVAGVRDAQVCRVAVCGGAGDSLIADAIAAGAELFVTGDLKHHVALDAREQGIHLIDAGHHATEHAALPAVQAGLQADATRRGLHAPVIASQVDTSPWS